MLNVVDNDNDGVIFASQSSSEPYVKVAFAFYYMKLVR